MKNCVETQLKCKPMVDLVVDFHMKKEDHSSGYSTIFKHNRWTTTGSWVLI